MKSKKRMIVAMVLVLLLVLSPVANVAVQAQVEQNNTIEEKLTLTKPSTAVLVIKKGKSYKLSYQLISSDTKSEDIRFASSDKKVATVSKKGEIKAIKNGYAKISVFSAKNKKLKYSIVLKVGTPITKVTLSTTSLSLEVGDSEALNATIQPKKVSYSKIRYASSDESVATVSSDGVVSAKRGGDATITAIAMDGSNKTATCNVAVAKKEEVKDNNTQNEEISSGTQGGGGSQNPSDNKPANGYKLVWQDEFDQSALNMNDWNYETHAPGWVNNELQEYTDSIDNIYVKDGKLVLKAIKTTTNNGGIEQNYYTSGKVTTQGKQDFKYGKFEIRAKGVNGQGLWPAIWMMPTDESFYGQWPKCGEIDIMEILGNEPNKAYGTIHYGEPHKEQQGTYILNEGTFADAYHTYSVEWEPSEMRFYIDGNLYHTVNDWFTKVEGKGEVAYPAPFDQPFYLQLNLAVGGNWPGNPDDTTNFEQAEFSVDYVRVYQKDSYNEDVQKPIKPEVVLRDPDSTGNYVINGDFNRDENLADDEGWGEKYALSGVGSAQIENNQLVIKTTNEGTVDYSIQIVQPNLPMKKGGEYRLTFDAYSDEVRDMIVDISGPDNGYARYFADTTVVLGVDKTNYEYTFTMGHDSDANGRLEFNLGNKNSKATVYISNVRLEKIGEVIIQEPEKSVLPDGNYVYNGEFQEGANRLDYWTVEKTQAADVYVTNDNGRRELAIRCNDSISLEDVLVKQNIALSANKAYVLTFDAYADATKVITMSINGEIFTPELTQTKQQFKYQFTTTDTILNKDLVFLVGVPGYSYIDNVRIAEAGLLTNGDFSNGFVGWEPFVDGSISSNVSWIVDSLKEKNAAAFGITNTGDQAWKIQLKQSNVHLEDGKWYELTFKAKVDTISSRNIMVALQRDGSSDDNWTPYSGEKVVNLNQDYQEFKLKFKMVYPTDEHTILTFSLGAVAGEVITQIHNVYIDDVVLEETVPDEIVITPSEGNMIKNPLFQLTNGSPENWEVAITAPGDATCDVNNNGIEFTISNVGTADWNIQLKQMDLSLQQNHKYQLKMKITSDVSRTIKVAMMTPTYDWYGGADIQLNKGITEVDSVITIDKDNSNIIGLFLSMGKIEGEDTLPGSIRIEEISLIDCTTN